MQDIPITNDANQSLTVRLDGTRYAIALKAGQGCMCCDMEIDGVTILTGQRIVAGTPLIPYEYLQVGNFMLITANEQLPDYTLFNSTQFLVYASPDEIAAFISG